MQHVRQLSLRLSKQLEKSLYRPDGIDRSWTSTWRWNSSCRTVISKRSSCYEQYARYTESWYEWNLATTPTNISRCFASWKIFSVSRKPRRKMTYQRTQRSRNNSFAVSTGAFDVNACSILAGNFRDTVRKFVNPAGEEVGQFQLGHLYGFEYFFDSIKTSRA